MNAIIIIENEETRKLYDNAAKYFSKAETTLILTLQELDEYLDEIAVKQNRRQLSDRSKEISKVFKNAVIALAVSDFDSENHRCYFHALAKEIKETDYIFIFANKFTNFTHHQLLQVRSENINYAVVKFFELLFRGEYNLKELFLRINRQRKYKHCNIPFSDMKSLIDNLQPINLRRKRIYINLSGLVLYPAKIKEMMLKRFPEKQGKQVFFSNFSADLMLSKKTKYCLDIFC